MSIHGDVVGVLNTANVATGGAHPEFLPEQSKAEEYVVVRRIATEPLNTLQGYAGMTKSTFVLECWAANKARALAIADNVRAAVAAASSIPTKTLEPASGEQYAPEVLELMEPVQYSIWHP